MVVTDIATDGKTIAELQQPKEEESEEPQIRCNYVHRNAVHMVNFKSGCDDKKMCYGEVACRDRTTDKTHYYMAVCQATNGNTSCPSAMDCMLDTNVEAQKAKLIDGQPLDYMKTFLDSTNNDQEFNKGNKTRGGIVL